MSESHLLSALLSSGFVSGLAEFLASQLLALGILLFLLGHGVLTLLVRLVDRVDPPPEPIRARQPADPAPRARRSRDGGPAGSCLRRQAAGWPRPPLEGERKA